MQKLKGAMQVAQGVAKAYVIKEECQKNVTTAPNPPHRILLPSPVILQSARSPDTEGSGNSF